MPSEVSPRIPNLPSLRALFPPVRWLVWQGLEQKKATEETSKEEEDVAEEDAEVVLEESDGDL